MQLGLYRTTLAAARFSQFKVSCLGKMNRGMKSSPEGKTSNSQINLTDKEEFPSLFESVSSVKGKRRIRIDLHTPCKQKSQEVQKIGPLQCEASTSNNNQNDSDLPTSSGKSSSSPPRNHKLRQTDTGHLGKKLFSRNPKLHGTYHESNQYDTDFPTSFGKRRSFSPINPKDRQTNHEHRGKNLSSRNPKLHETYHDLNQNDTDVPTSFGKSRLSSPRNSKFLQTNHEHRGKNVSCRNYREAKNSSRSSIGTSIGEPFDICQPETRESDSRISANEENRRKWVPKVQSAEDNEENKDDMEQSDDTEDSVEKIEAQSDNTEDPFDKIEKVLRPGMVLFKHYLSQSEQVDIVNKCRELGLGPGGFYRPGYDDGAKLRLYMMCLGLDWSPQTKKYGKKRHHDNTAPPDIPEELTSLVCRVLDDSHTLIKRDLEAINIEDELPLMSPDVCIVNFYTTNGRLGLHQDRDESKWSLQKGLPVVSISIGDSAEFLYGDDRDVDKAERVLLESGDVLIFGGHSRHIFHGVKTIIPDTAPPTLLEGTNLRPGRLNLTFRKY